MTTPATPASQPTLVLVTYEVPSTGENRSPEVLGALADEGLVHATTHPGLSRADFLLACPSDAAQGALLLRLRHTFPGALTWITDLVALSRPAQAGADLARCLYDALHLLQDAPVPVVYAYTEGGGVTLVVQRNQLATAQRLLDPRAEG